MTDIATDNLRQRQKMLDGQLLPAGVIDETLLKGFLATDRAEFVDSAMGQKRCYRDEPLPTADGRVLLPPVAAGILLQAAMAHRTHSASGDKNGKLLVIGGGHGYECNILASTGRGVVALAGPRDKIKKMLLKSNFTVAMAEGDDIAKGCKAQGPFTAIVILGVVAMMPTGLFDQLVPGGAMVMALRDNQSPPQKNQLANLVRITPHHKAGGYDIDYLGQVADVPPMPEFASPAAGALAAMMGQRKLAR